MKISGVYSITNKVTGELYIGSSKNIKQRWATHRSPSQWKKQSNSKLYKAMAKYGRDNFTIEVIEETTDLRNREQYYIEQLSPTYNDRYADGIDTERSRLYRRKYYKEYYEVHIEENKARMEKYNNRLCLYEGETLTLAALSARLRQQGIANPYKEAKNYLIVRDFNNLY